MSPREKSIAIDGPAGAGKSTVARKLAERLGYLYVDTGAMYRALTLKALRRGIRVDDTLALAELARTTQINVVNTKEGLKVLLDGEDVTSAIRSPEVGRAVSAVASVQEVRREMVRLQRALAEVGPVVMEGRDIGTVVLPEAKFKFFLTADVEERARRRYRELKEAGHEVDFATLLKELKERDRRDSTREVDPLVRADDAELIDCTHMTIEEVVELLLTRIK